MTQKHKSSQLLLWRSACLQKIRDAHVRGGEVRGLAACHAKQRNLLNLAQHDTTLDTDTYVSFAPSLTMAATYCSSVTGILGKPGVKHFFSSLLFFQCTAALLSHEALASTPLPSAFLACSPGVAEVPWLWLLLVCSSLRVRV